VKPAPFTYHDPRSVAEATELLATHDNTRVLAGGQSLMPMMNFRYAMPDHLIDLNKVGELAYIRVENQTLNIGAMTRQRDLEFSADIAKHCPVLQAALAHVGHRQTRNRGTLGGSLCHQDPSAELLNIAALLDATMHVISARGTRDIPCADFALAYMTTALEPDEMLASVTLKISNKSNSYGFSEFARRHGDFAIVACAALLELDAQGNIGNSSIALSGLSHAPIRPAAIEQALRGKKPDAATFKAAAAEAEKLEAGSDAYVSSAYRQHLARVLTYRALEQAATQAKVKQHG
jgi:aerobic carbon-monoxide dehydrogenase medium subunit